MIRRWWARLEQAYIDAIVAVVLVSIVAIAIVATLKGSTP